MLKHIKLLYLNQINLSQKFKSKKKEIEEYNLKSYSEKKRNHYNKINSELLKEGKIKLPFNSTITLKNEKTIRNKRNKRNYLESNGTKFKSAIYNSKLNFTLDQNTKNKTKYKFIVNHSKKIKNNYSDLPSIITNYNNKMTDYLNKENEKNFTESLCVIPKKRFSEKFRIYRENNIENEIKKKNNLNLINIFKSNFDSLTKIEKKINPKKKKSKKEIYERLIKIIYKAYLHFKRCDISIREFYLSYKIKNYSFSCELTEYLIKEIKDKNKINVDRILDSNKSCVLDFDYFKRTPLHWAAKRNFYQIIPKIINYGADVEAKDFLGKTALHTAIINDYFESVIFLFLYYSSPFTVSLSGKKPIDYAKSDKIISICKRASALHVIHMFGNQENYYENVQRGFAFFVENECKKDLEPEAYSIIKGMAQFFRENMHNY